MSSLGIALNSSNDIFVDSNGNLAMVTDQDSVELAILCAARTQIGEMIYQTDQGVAYFETLFNGNPNVQQFEGSLRQTISSVTGVVEIVNLSIQITNGALTYQAKIMTIYGLAFLEQTIPNV